MAVNSITFGGVNSADFGIYISGEGVFNAPKRDVEMIAIPGRNGELALDKGRFENIEVTYPAFNFEPNDYETFAKNLSDFRNAICSLRGYQRLTDTFHPDEYRMAAYIGGLEIKPIKYNTASEFSIIFDCKPQRYLTDGETPITLGEWGETETVSGDIVEIENDGIEAVKSLSVELEPIQDLHGYEKPWSGGNGKNKLPPKNNTATNGGLTFSCNGDNIWHISGTSTTMFPQWLTENGTLSFPVGTTLTLSKIVNNAPSGAFVYGILYERDTPTGSNIVTRSTRNVDSRTFTIEHPCQAFVVVAEGNGETYTNTSIALQIELGSTATAFEPYSNICPISGHTECDTYVSPTTSETDAEVFTTALGRTVYGGEVEIVEGSLSDKIASRTVTASEITQFQEMPNLFNIACTADDDNKGSTTAHDVLMDRFARRTVIIQVGEWGKEFADSYTVMLNTTDLDEAKSIITGTQITYPLKTPSTYDLTGNDVELIEGTNYIWSDGRVTVEHGQNPNYLVNPTRFESSPLLMVEGYGDIGFNGYDITLTDDDIGEYDMKVSKQVNIDNGTNYVSVMDGTFPAEIAETGNTIIATSMGISFASALAGNTANNITLGDITLTCTDDSVTYWGRSEKWKRLANRYHALAEIHVAEATFQLGTVHSFEVSGEVAYSVGSTDRRIHVSITFASDENGHIHVEAFAYDHKPSSQSADRRKLKARGVSAPEIQIISTATVLGHPTYVDCDLGEAYRIVEDEYIPLNRYIDLGSDLPKLAVGANEVTTDDTITELQIVPRWWRV